MSLSSDVIDRLPYVEGVLNYLAPMAGKPMNLAYDPPPGVARSTGVPEPHRMTIYDARPVAARLSLFYITVAGLVALAIGVGLGAS